MDNPTKSQWEVLIQQNQVLLEYLNGQRDLLNDQKTITRIVLERLQNPLTVTRTQTALSFVNQFNVATSALSLPTNNFSEGLTYVEFSTFQLDERTEEIMINWSLGAKQFEELTSQTWPAACVLLAFHESIGEPVLKTMILSPDSCCVINYPDVFLTDGTWDPVSGAVDLTSHDFSCLRTFCCNFNRRIPCTAKYVSVVGMLREDPGQTPSAVYNVYVTPTQISANALFPSGEVMGPFSLVELGR